MPQNPAERTGITAIHPVETFFAEAIEVLEDGISGVVIITDEQGNIVDTFTGTAAEFQASGEWRLFEE